MNWPFVSRAWLEAQQEVSVRLDDMLRRTFVILEKREAELKEAHNRLYAAFKDGYTIPPEPSPPSEPEPTLSPLLQPFVEEIEGAKGKLAKEKQIRRWLKDGRTEGSILLELEEPKAD